MVVNADSVLEDVDRVLRVSSPPAVEYIYVPPRAQYTLRFLGLLGGHSESYANPYGHAAIRYTLPCGEEQVMNICGKPGYQMTNFLHPRDYLFGSPALSEQGGVTYRNFVGFRVEDVPEKQVLAMHEYFLHLSRAEVAGKAGYSMIGFLLSNYLSSWWGEYGNCAYWTSRGLEKAQVLDTPSAFPKVVFTKLYFSQLQRRKNRQLNPDAHIVFYHAADDPRDRPPTGWFSPGYWRSSQSSMFNQLSRFAHAVVRVDDAGVATVSRRRPWRPFRRASHLLDEVLGRKADSK